MNRKRSLIKHFQTPSMSEAEQIRHLSALLRKCDDPAKALVLSREIRLLRELKKGIKKSHGGPQKKVKPVEPEAVDQEKVLEAERKPSAWLERPNPVEEQAKRLRIRAELKARREAAENPPLQASQSDVCEVTDVVAPPKQTGFSITSPALVDMFQAVTRPCDGDEHDGTVGMTNAILRDFSDREPEPREPVGGYFSDGMGGAKRG